MPAGEPRAGSAPWLRGAAAAAALAALGAWVFVIARPPTVEELERDVWAAWLRNVTDDEDRTVADLLVENQRDAALRLLKTFGELTRTNGKWFLLATNVRWLSLRRPGEGDEFAEWSDPGLAPNWRSQPDPSWRLLTIPVLDPDDLPVGEFEASYRFFNDAKSGGLGLMPTFRRMRLQDRWLLTLVTGLAVATALALAANAFRRHERARRLLSQRRTLELARQMCHELRNGLWAFALEGRNLQHLFGTLAGYLRREPAAFAEAAERTPELGPAAERLRRRYRKLLAESSVDPETDVAGALAQAEEAYKHVESFSRYLNLTVEELDRNLLGGAPEPHPERLRLSEVWAEARDLLELRLHSLGVRMADPEIAGPDAVRADRRDLVHVFVNLAKNAAEALREEHPPRVVECRIFGGEGEIRCEVRNGGPPIPPEALARIFAAGVSSKGAGRGVGLALVQELLQRAHATIAAASDSAGTVFTLHFPPAPAAADAPAPPITEAESTQRGEPR